MYHSNRPESFYSLIETFLHFTIGTLRIFQSNNLKISIFYYSIDLNNCTSYFIILVIPFYILLGQPVPFFE